MPSAYPYQRLPKSCLVTGGSGFVGRRLVEMLIENGCSKVISLDITPPPPDAINHPNVQYIVGNLTKIDDLMNACKEIECVFHIAALVGPYHHKDAYIKVNYEGTVNLLNACRANGVKKIVMSSSPSTRFPYPDPNVNNLTEDELFKKNKGHYAPKFLQPYAETKAMGEKAILDACGNGPNDLLTIAVAPHQVYGPRDGLFLPNFLVTAASGKLRIFGNGKNMISFCHVDNYCHGLILGADALYPGSKALGKFYIVTDGGGVEFWSVLDKAIVGMGFESIQSKMKIPSSLMMFLAYIVVFIGKIISFFTGTPEHVVNYHLKLNPFAIKMLIINRCFNIEAAKRDLHYKPLIEFEKGWDDTIKWFKENWLPKYRAENGKK